MLLEIFVIECEKPNFKSSKFGTNQLFMMLPCTNSSTITTITTTGNEKKIPYLYLY